MLQRHLTSTTSFIVSSDESLSKPSSLLSSSTSACGQSTDSGENMSTATDQSYFSQSSADSMCTNNETTINRQRHSCYQVNGRYSMLPPQPVVPPPPPPPPLMVEGTFPELTTISKPNVSQNNVQAIYETNNIIKQNPNSSYSVQATSNINRPLELTTLMPMNVKGMLLHGLSSEEMMRNWLKSISCDELTSNFLDQGYDIHLITKMTPQDLAAIGCKSPTLRKKLLDEIKKLNLDYELPEYRPMILEQWLDSIKLKSYYTLLLAEGYDTVEKVCQLTWEDLEEIGIIKLGHQKRLLLGIDKVKKSMKVQEERQHESAIYEVHPNHRVSLNGASTISRARSGLFQIRSRTALDHRGLPVATVLPALKHITSPIINPDISSQSSKMMWITNQNEKNKINNQMETVKMNELDANTLRRYPPPPPPLRNDSLLTSNGSDCSTYGSNSAQIGEATYKSNSSFLNTPKQSDAVDYRHHSLTIARHPITPIREAPMPPHLLNRFSVPQKIDEEPSNFSTGLRNSEQIYAIGSQQMASDR